MEFRFLSAPAKSGSRRDQVSKRDEGHSDASSGMSISPNRERLVGPVRWIH